MDRECATQEAEEKCIQGLVDKPEERGQLGKSRHIWKDNIKIISRFLSPTNALFY